MGAVGVKSTKRGDRVRTALAASTAQLRALSGAPGAWLLLLAGWVLLSGGAWVQFGPGWSAMLGGVLLMVFAATLVDVDRSRR